MSTESGVRPIHRVILVVDVEGSTTRTNAAKARLRRAMYGLLEEALWASGITEQDRDPMIDRGDGVLVLIHPVDQVPKTLLLDTFVPTLRGLLAEHNGQQPPDQRFRLRTALHAGEVHYDARGAFGEALDVACRLLDAPQLKIRLGQTTAPLVLVVSDDVYRCVIRHGYERIDDRAFEPLVQVEVGGYPHRGWVHLPAHLAEQPWPLRHVTGDERVDLMLHRAGQELDARAVVRSLDPDVVLAQIYHSVYRNERDHLPGTG